MKKILAKALDDDHAKILKRMGATEIIHPERDMAIRVSRNLSRLNVLDFIPLADEFDMIQACPSSKLRHLMLGRSADIRKIKELK